MLISSSYSGCLLAAHPLRPEEDHVDLQQSVIMVMRHDSMGAVGLRINRPFPNGLTVTHVMRNIGLSNDFDHENLYQGGPHGGNRVFVIHTLDWSTSTTIKFDNNLGISGDISIISALAAGEGPEYFRAVAGFNLWAPGELDQEINEAESPELSWIWTPSSEELIFEAEGYTQWRSTINAASKIQVAQWF